MFGSACIFRLVDVSLVCQEMLTEVIKCTYICICLDVFSARLTPIMGLGPLSFPFFKLSFQIQRFALVLDLRLVIHAHKLSK